MESLSVVNTLIRADKITHLEGLHEIGLDSILHQNSKSTGNTNVIRSDRLATLASSNDHSTETSLHVLQTSGESEDSHNFTGNSDIETSLSLVAHLSRVLTDGNLAKETLVGVKNSVPGDGVLVDVQTSKVVNFLGSQVIGVGLVDSEFLEALEHERGEFTLALLGGYQSGVESLVALGGFVENTGIEGSS